MLGINRILMLFPLCLLWFVSAAQDPFSIAFTTENGLPSNTVYDILEDKKGFIWIASDAGLTRYDGYEFKTYTCDEQTSRAGSNLFEDPLGRVWYQNFDGFLYYVENNRMKFLPNQHPIGFLNAGLIKDHLYIVQAYHIAIRDIRTFKTLKRIPIREYVAATQQDDKSFYYVDRKTMCLDYSGKRTILKAPFLPHSDFPSLMKRGKRDMWFVPRGIETKTCYLLKNDSLYPHFRFLPKAHLQQLSYTNDSRFWLCTTQGAVSVNEFTLKQSRIFFPNHNISGVFRDSKYNYWFITQNTGIFFVPDFNRRLLFQDLHPRKAVIYGNTLYLSTNNDRIYKVNLNNMQANLLFNGKTNHMINHLVLDPVYKRLFFTSSALNCIREDGQNILNISHFAAKDYAVIDKKYVAFAVSGYCGIFEVDVSAKSTSNWDSLYRKNVTHNGFIHSWSHVNGVRGKSVTYDNELENIYYATNIGLFKRGKKILKQIKYRKKTLYLTKVNFYKDRVIALSTSGKILVIDQQDQVKSISKKLGLQNILIQYLEIVDNKLIVASQNHVYIFDLTKNLRKITDVPSYNLDITSVTLWKNKIVLVSEKGLLLIPIRTMHVDAGNTTFIINGIRINGRHEIGPHKKAFLSHLQNNLEIRYSILDYGQSHNAKLQYRINNGVWENTNTNTRSLKLASLSPGDYTISFRLENNPHLHNVSFNISKPWYATWWFISGILILMLGSVFFYFRWRIRRLQLRNKLLSEKIELEEHLTRSMLTSIKSQMNPHFFYNALNTIQYFIFTNDKQNASTYLSKFSKLTRMILEMSDKEHVILREEINALTLYLDIEKVRFDGDFEFSITVSPEADPDLIRIPSMIIQPYVENAIKHGLLHKKGQKKLKITINRTGNELEIIIDDNGIGRDMANELNKKKNDHHRSFATSANQKRLELLNKGRNTAVGVTYIDKNKDGRAEGTTVIITIPINI